MRTINTLSSRVYRYIFQTILCELTHCTNIHEQQPYSEGTLSQRTERSADRRVRQETDWLAERLLLRVPTIRRTTDTFLFISHTTNVLLFKFRCNILIGIRVIKEMLGSVASGTPCITDRFRLYAELSPICYFLALLGAHHILHVSRIRVKR